MKISTGLVIDSNRLFVIYDEDENDEPRTACFRGIHKKLAGNFFQWNSFTSFAFDKRFDFIKEFHICVERTYEECRKKKKSSTIDVVTLDFEDNVGWGSTDDREKYQDDDLEEFRPNERCVLLRVKPDLTYIEAPRTSLVTIVYGITIEEGDITAYIQTIYPGVYFGPLYNTEGNDDVNITERQGRVFFDVNHPGE